MALVVLFALLGAVQAQLSRRILVGPNGAHQSDWAHQAAAFAGWASGSELTPTEEGGDGGEGRGRRLQSAVKQCPQDPLNGVPRADAQFGTLTLTGSQGPQAIGIYDSEAGYGAYLLCQWLIAPTDRQQMTLLTDAFDVDCCNRDTVEIIQLKCTATVNTPGIERCDTRQRQTLLTYPTSFAQDGVLPPTITVSETGGFGVQVLIRFSTKFATGRYGFTASYTTSAFDLLAVTPQLMPTSMFTTLTLAGVGLDPTAQLKCYLSSQVGDVLYVPATVVSAGIGNTSAQCLVRTGTGTGTTYYGPDETRLFEGVYQLRVEKVDGQGVTTTTPTVQNLVVYESPLTYRCGDANSSMRIPPDCSLMRTQPYEDATSSGR